MQTLSAKVILFNTYIILSGKLYFIYFLWMLRYLQRLVNLELKLLVDDERAQSQYNISKVKENTLSHILKKKEDVKQKSNDGVKNDEFERKESEVYYDSEEWLLFEGDLSFIRSDEKKGEEHVNACMNVRSNSEIPVNSAIHEVIIDQECAAVCNKRIRDDPCSLLIGSLNGLESGESSQETKYARHEKVGINQCNANEDNDFAVGAEEHLKIDFFI